MADKGKKIDVSGVQSTIQNIQSSIQKSANAKQKQAASSSAAAKTGSTQSPTITTTPKVTQTAKAMPSITIPTITPVYINKTTTNTTNNVDIKNLLSPVSTNTLKKAATPNLLDGDTGKTTLSSVINKWLTETPKAITEKLGNAITSSTAYQKTVDFFSNTAIDAARTGISTAQGYLNKLGNSNLIPSNLYPTGLVDKALIQYANSQLNKSELGQNLKDKRDSVLESIFDVTENRDRILRNEETYEKSKKTADEWSKQGKGIMDAINEGNWDVLTTRVGEAVGQMLPSFIMAVLSKNPKLTAGTIFGTVFGDSYQRSLREINSNKDFSSLTREQKDDLATLMAVAEAGIESLGDVLELAPFMKGKFSFANMLGLKNALLSFVANLEGGALVEGGEEVVTEILQTVFKQAYGGSDKITAQELGEIFSDTFLIMQFVGLLGGAKGGLDTHKRNTAVNLLSREADKYDNFNDFEAAAERGGVEDKELIQDAWAKSKGLTSKQTEILKYDVNYVENQEEKATELYDEQGTIENQLENLRENPEENKEKISKLEKKLQDINSQIEEIDRSIQEYMEVYGQQQEELPAQQGIASIEGGDNLSTQTMREISEEKEVKIPNSPEGYVSLAEALKQPGNTYLTNLSETQLKSLKKDIQNTWKAEGFYGQNNKAYRYIIKAINAELESRREGETISSTKKLTFKNAQDFVNKMIAIDKKNGDWSEGKVDKYLREKYFGWFLRNNIEGDFSAHLPGLKGINLKQIEKKLTDKNLRDIAEMIALVSKTFGIDFNKIINDSNISVNIVDNQNKFLYNTHSYGVMDWMPTKEQVRDLIKRTGHGDMGLAGEIIKMGVAITLDRGPEWSGSTMAHELMHLLDFAISTEEGLPLKYDNGTDYTSSIEGDYDWKTFKVGTYRPHYYNRWTEILARYAQQYYSWKNHPEVFKKYCKKDWYWTEEEFLKLVPKFEQFIKDRLGAKLLDEENQFYYDIVKKVNENKFKTISLELEKEGLSKMDVKQKLDQIEEEYGFIMQHLDEMTGTLKEEMETYVQLSNLQSNYEMAKAKGEEYLKMLNTTPEQQGTIDNITTTVLPPEPVPGNPNPTPSNNPEIIKLGLPYFGGSNIEEGIGDIIKGGEGEKLGESYMKEEDIIKIRNKKNRIKGFFKECGQAFKDVFTPAISRIYNISPRVAGRLITMETQKDINIYRYRQKAKGFVETLGSLKGKQALEVKMALLDYGALASEQGENIEQYKKDEVSKLKEVLLRNGFKEGDINDMFSVLDDIGQQYKDAGLSVTLTDMYFPRVVKDYEGLIDYMNRVSGKDIKVNKISLMMKIRNIQQDPNLTDEEKEAKIRRAISIEFKQPGTTSQHGKERKIGLLSDWGEGIYAYYESPIESIDHYIVTMTNAIQRQLFLGGMKEDADITEGDILNQSTAESVSTIIGKLVEQGKINEDDIEELQKSILAVLSKKPSPKSVTAIKDITYISTITNFLSAINQLDDLGMVILKDKSGLKHIVKTIAGRAGIKYDDLGLEDAYEMFREEGGITNWLFKKSFFNMFDRLGKTSFINTAWESVIHQARNEKTRKYLYTRLQSMYGTESADRMMKKIDSNNYKDSNGQIDIEILRDLLYQLGSTQPIYTSAMPVTYLNHPWARLSYALSSFTLKRMDWLWQGMKEVNRQHGKVAAGAWVMSVSFFLAMFGAAIGDIGDLLKGKKEDTFLWNLINKGIDEALAAGGSDMLDSWLKIWDLSEYDLKTLDRQGMQGLMGSKISPFIFDLGKDVVEAVWEHDANEITDLAKYVPIFGKLLYYWFWDELSEDTSKSKWSWGEEKTYDWGDNNKYDWGDKKEYNR